MGKRLSENLSSQYFSAANRLGPKRSRRRIVAYVESYDDVFFWRTVLSRFENDDRYFQVMLPTRNQRLERGKKAVLMSLLKDKVGADMIACVDADYDYLIQGATSTSREIISNPYVFHTYAYAIENLQCYAPSLHDVCVAATLNDHEIFDVSGYLRRYSGIIYPLFVWNILFYRTPHYGQFTLTEFSMAIELGNFSLVHAEELLQRLQGKVSRKVAQLQRRYPRQLPAYEKLKRELQQLGVTPDNTYLYIQGHHLFDRVVVPILTKVCGQLVREREGEISRDSKHYIQQQNELSCYANSVENVASMLKKNVGYMLSAPFKHIVEDVEKFLEESNSGKQDAACH